MITKENGLYRGTKSEDKEQVESYNKSIKWHAFQNFQSFLSIEEVKRVRQFLIGIEKELFLKGGRK